MDASHQYPVFLSLAGRHCLVAGLGAVGVRKLRGLLVANVASVLALDIRLPAELSGSAQRLLQSPRVAFSQGHCQMADIAASFLVFACTGSTAENLRIATMCRGAGVLCNTVTDPQAGSFILPAVARCGTLYAAISTSGQSPHLAKVWRKELEEWLAPRERLVWLLGRLRPLVQSLGLSQAENAALFERIATSPILGWLNNDADIDKCHEWLKSELPKSLTGRLSKIFSEYAHVFA